MGTEVTLEQTYKFIFYTSMLWLLRIDIHGPVYLFEKQQGSVFRSPMKNEIKEKMEGKKGKS